jgi:hypothetical protein
MDPLHATIEEFTAAGFTHVACHCPRCRVTRLRPISWLPRISLGLTIMSRALSQARCLIGQSELSRQDLVETQLGDASFWHHIMKMR